MFGKWRKGTGGKGERTRLLGRLASRASGAPSTWDFARKCLTLLARILVGIGYSPKRLSRLFADICSRLEEPKHRFDPELLRYIADLPHVITRWYTDPKYLDAQGTPRPLPMRAEGPSLSALIARVFPHDDPGAVAESLRKVGSVRQHGALYEPVSQHCIYTGDSARLHAVSTLAGFLDTVHHNVEGGEPKLLERTVTNPCFPRNALPAFYRRLTDVVEEVLEAFDVEMQSIEESATGGPRVRVAVSIFAFENAEASRPLDSGGKGARALEPQPGPHKPGDGKRE